MGRYLPEPAHGQGRVKVMVRGLADALAKNREDKTTVFGPNPRPAETLYQRKQLFEKFNCRGETNGVPRSVVNDYRSGNSVADRPPLLVQAPHLVGLGDPRGASSRAGAVGHRQPLCGERDDAEPHRHARWVTSAKEGPG